MTPNFFDPDNPFLASIDIGSNGFHLAICRYQPSDDKPNDKADPKLKKIATMSEKVQLGAGLDEQGKLSKEVQEKGLDCLRRFADRVRHISPQCLRVVATNALRQAVNGDEFVKLANEILPRPIEIISGREEARLIYFGVANFEPSAKKRLVIDIGGGSSELIIGRHKTPLVMESAQMGAVSFAKRFFNDGQMTAHAFESAIWAGKKEIIAHQNHYKKTGFDGVVGTSGTIKAIQKSLEELSLGKEITLKSALILKEKLIEFGTVDAIEFKAVKSHRKAIFPAGLAILIAIMQVFDIKKLRYCDSSLKEGVIFDMLGRLADKDIRDKSLDKFLGQFDLDKKHAKRTAKTALDLFVSSQAVLALDDNDKTMLVWASRLHEIGLVIGHSGYHRHSAYMVENAEIAGFSKSDQATLATLIRHHRRKIGVKECRAVRKLGEFGDKVVYLVLLFRLATLLNHARKDLPNGAVALTVISPKEWHININKQLSHYATLLPQLQDEVAIFKGWGVKFKVQTYEPVQQFFENNKNSPPKSPNEANPTIKQDIANH